VSVGVAHRLRAIPGPGFGKDPVDVRLDRRFADEQRPGDLPVGPAGRDQPEHLGLARGQLPVGGLGRLGRCPGRGGQQPLLDQRIQHCLPGGGCLQGTADLGSGRVLGQVAERPGLQRADDRLVVGVRGEHDDAGVRMLGGDPPGRGHPVAAGHVQVHEHDLRADRGDKLGRRLTVRRLAGHDDSWQRAEQQH
jgi:hypothetical protein